MFAIIADGNSIIEEISGFFNSEAFYHPTFKIIYDSAYGLFKKNIGIDILSLSEDLTSSGNIDKIGGIVELMRLSSKLASTANTEYFARVVMQKYLQRKLIEISFEGVNQGYDTTIDVFDAINNIENQLNKLSDVSSENDVVSTSDIYMDVFEDIKITLENREKGIKPGIQTGFKGLDDIISGFQSPDLIILGGRPGLGKTALGLAFGAEALKQDKNVAFFSLEMSKTQILKRLVSFVGEIELHRILKGLLNTDELSRVTDVLTRISKMKLSIDDTSALNIMDLKRKCRKLKREGKLDLIIIDYLQLLTVPKEEKKIKRHEEVGFISRNLKMIAKELNTPIIALAQVGRGSDARGKSDRKPKLSDLRESGDIENDADLVLFPYRESYYDPNAIDEQGNSLRNEAEIIVAKNRHGETTTIPIKWKGEYVKYCDAYQDVHTIHANINYNENFDNAFLRGDF